MRVGVISASPSVLPGANGAGSSQPRPDRSTTRRTSEKPLEWTPEEGSARIDVACLEIGARQQLGALDGAHGKSGEVVVAFCIEARHLRGFAADQCASGLAAAFGDAGDDARGHADIELAAWRNSRERTAARRPAPRDR